MKKHTVTFRFSPEDADLLRKLLNIVVAREFDFQDEYDPEGVSLDHSHQRIEAARRLRDATLMQQYPHDPSKRPATHEETVAAQQKCREKWLPIMARVSTQELLQWRVACYRTHGGHADYDPWYIGYDPFYDGNGDNCPLALIKEVLATREHIPNKEERKEARRQKAKAGRQKGRRDK